MAFQNPFDSSTILNSLGGYDRIQWSGNQDPSEFMPWTGTSTTASSAGPFPAVYGTSSAAPKLPSINPKTSVDGGFQYSLVVKPSTTCASLNTSNFLIGMPPGAGDHRIVGDPGGFLWQAWIGGAWASQLLVDAATVDGYVAADRVFLISFSRDCAPCVTGTTGNPRVSVQHLSSGTTLASLSVTCHDLAIPGGPPTSLTCAGTYLHHGPKMLRWF